MRALAVSVCLLSSALLLAGGTTAAAQAPAFDDVPPWHWATDALEQVAAADVMIGYPSHNTAAILNSVRQVYEAFARPAHPAAREWAERFLVELPRNWPLPLERSPLAEFQLSGPRAIIVGDEATMTFFVTTVIREAPGMVRRSVSVRVEARRDAEGRWRIRYSDLVTGQPAIFR